MRQDTSAPLNLQSLAAALGGEVNGGQVAAPGPQHSANDRSLSVKLDANAPGGFVVHSFAGDDPIGCRDHVRTKLGLPAFKNGRAKRASEADITAAVMAAAAMQARDEKPKGRIVAEYNYTDAGGVLLYQVVRLEPKDFRQRRPDGKAGWIWKVGERRVLYRWPELLKYPDGTIFICEGEKDANRVASLGHCATTVAAGEWTAECVAALNGRNCIILQDNDNAGHKKALAAARALYGTANSVRVVLLPDLPLRGDVSNWLDADPYRAKRLVDVCFDVPPWTPDAEPVTDTKAETEAAGKSPLPFIAISAWQNQPVPERVWTVKDRIPGGAVTLMSGEGGVGKTILGLHCAAGIALGRDWLGTMPTPGAAIVLACEDDEHELHRRLDRIVAHYGASFAELSNLHVLSLAGADAIMAAPHKSGLIAPTNLFKQLHEAAYDIRPRLIVIDNSADVFAGNENDRAEVRQFITLLRGMAIATGAGVLLTSHPSLTGITNKSGLSGSTAWNASVRSRLYFRRATTEKDEEPDSDLRVLEVVKSNYGPVGETITLRWNNGLFLPVSGIGNLEKLAAEQRAEELFLKLLAQFTRQIRNTSEKPNAPTYAPTLFAREDEARSSGVRKADFEAAMRRLFAADKICLQLYGPPSKATSRLAIK